jgi:hypothetical protein
LMSRTCVQVSDVAMTTEAEGLIEGGDLARGGWRCGARTISLEEEAGLVSNTHTHMQLSSDMQLSRI